ncbi:MAG TPA: spore germination protein GerW family protein [Microbacteriaceae bacterium]
MANLTLQLAETVKNAGVRSVYGDPVELDGVTIVPVALVAFGFGGGSDSGDEETAASGGGGGGYSVPIGAYVRDRNGMRFEPNLISLLAVGIPFVCVAGRALSKVIRALKK